MYIFVLKCIIVYVSWLSEYSKVIEYKNFKGLLSLYKKHDDIYHNVFDCTQVDVSLNYYNACILNDLPYSEIIVATSIAHLNLVNLLS